MTVLVVAATEREIAEVRGADTLCCGIGPVEAATAVGKRLSERRYAALLHVGIAGARTLAPGTVVIGSESVYADIIAPHTTLPRVIRLASDDALRSAVEKAVPEAEVLPIATSGRVGGGLGYDVEAMEGFGVLRAAAVAAVPALELRVISNLVREHDRSAWKITEALEVLRRLTPRLVEVAREASFLDLV